MKSLLDALLRSFFLLWARWGRASGILYQAIDRSSKYFSHTLRRRVLYNGIKIDCDLRDHVQQQIYFFGAYEPIESSLFLSLMPEGGTVIDAGANVGFYTLMMANQVGPEGRVFAFEPVPRNFKALVANLELNRPLSQVRAECLALWSREEVLELNLAKDHLNNCGGFSAGSVEGTSEKVRCQAVSLESYFQKESLARWDGLKIDIEGAELFAFKGMFELLKKYEPVILLEICITTCKAFDYHPREILQLLQPLGYRIYRIGVSVDKSGWVSDLEGIVQSNVLLVPPRIGEWVPFWDCKEIYQKFCVHG